MTNQPVFNWPTDEDGNPLALVSYSSNDKIPTGKYAQTQIGPATATKFTDDFQAGFADCVTVVNEVLEDERNKVLEELEGANS